MEARIYIGLKAIGASREVQVAVPLTTRADSAQAVGRATSGGAEEDLEEARAGHRKISYGMEVNVK